MLLEPRTLDVQCITPAGLHRMAYYEWGDAHNPRVLVCVHGLTRSGRDFDFLARALAADYRVVCPDIVGRGGSSWLRNPQLYQIPTYVADMMSLLARLNVPRVDWLGTSMGGLIGMGLASLPDTPIRRLLLNDVGPVLSSIALQRIGEYLGLAMRFANIASAEQFVRRVSAAFGPHSDAQWRFLTENVMKWDGSAYVLHYDPAIALPFQQLAEQAAANSDQLLWHFYDAIRCPTLVVRGADSDLLSPETHQAMAQRGPKAQLVEVPGVGHAPTFIQPEQIAIAKDFFLQE